MRTNARSYAERTQLGPTRSIGCAKLVNARSCGEVLMTFSIVAFDPESRSWGVAVASKCLAVGYAVPWGGAEVGAIATQALANLSYGPDGLELLRSGLRRRRGRRPTHRRRPAGRPAPGRRRRLVRPHRQPHGNALHRLEGTSARRELHGARQPARRAAGRRCDGRGVRPRAGARRPAPAAVPGGRPGRRR